MSLPCQPTSLRHTGSQLGGPLPSGEEHSLAKNRQLSSDTGDVSLRVERRTFSTLSPFTRVVPPVLSARDSFSAVEADNTASAPAAPLSTAPAVPAVVNRNSPGAPDLETVFLSS